MKNFNEFPTVSLIILYFTSAFNFLSAIIYLIKGNIIETNDRIYLSMLFLGISAILHILININDKLIKK